MSTTRRAYLPCLGITMSGLINPTAEKLRSKHIRTLEAFQVSTRGAVPAAARHAR